MPRIALIHALSHSVAPINHQLQHDWPQARRMNLLDDSLSADLADAPNGLDAAMQRRFDTLADYALSTGADAILFTCSAFGPCIESVAQRTAPLPVLKPNEAMIEDASSLLRHADSTAYQGCLGLLATFAPTLESMPREFDPQLPLRTHWVQGALQALNDGDAKKHDALIAEAARALAQQGCTVLALAQFSMARAQQVAQKASGLPVLTTTASAVAKLRRCLAAVTLR